MTEKEVFIEKLKETTKQFAVDVIDFCNTLKKCNASNVIKYQLIKSATSTGANYRAACRARSKSEFFSKLCIVVEEADESGYWFEIIEETQLSNDIEKLKILKDKSTEIIRIMNKAKNSTYKK